MSTLTFYRIKPEYTDPNDIIADRDDASVRCEPVRVAGKRIGELYVKRIQRSTPTWLPFFGESVDLSGIRLSTASLAAVLLVRQDDAFYGVVFGYGASLLAEGVTDARFGLRATLNAVEPSQLRSIDHKRLEAISRNTREQLSRAGDLDQFGVDINRDLLRAVTGAPSDAKYGTRLSGADQLTATADIQLETLTDALRGYYELSKQARYKKNFPWVDNILAIRDGRLKADLDKHLAKQLAAGSDTFWLAPPEVIEWDKTIGFRYRNTSKGDPYTDLDLASYYSECGSAKDLHDGRRLEQDRIFHIRSDNESGRHSWSVIRCLLGEMEFKKERYVLNEGMWYRIDDDFLGALDDFIGKIKTTIIDLPEYDDKNEGAYNRRAWERNKSQLALLDQSFITYPNHGKVEVCDIYTRDRQLVHVKRLSGSGTLSHLFNQGAVSAELLRFEEGFRTQFLQKIPGFEWGKPADAIEPKEFEVCYAIIQHGTKPLTLPFFSKLTARTTLQHLSGLGFKASLIGIPSK